MRILQRNLKRTYLTLQPRSFSFLTQRTYSSNIFIGVRIIKEMPGSVASGTHCIFGTENYTPGKCIYTSFSERLNPFLKILLFILYRSIEFLFIALLLTQCI